MIPLQIVSITSFLENTFIGKIRGMTPVSQTSDSSQPESCEQFATAALNVLGLLPYESLLSQQARCLYLQTGLTECPISRRRKRLNAC